MGTLNVPQFTEGELSSFSRATQERFATAIAGGGAIWLQDQELSKAFMDLKRVINAPFDLEPLAKDSLRRPHRCSISPSDLDYFEIDGETIEYRPYEALIGERGLVSRKNVLDGTQKEYFQFGIPEGYDEPSGGLASINRWPSDCEATAFRELAETYFDQLTRALDLTIDSLAELWPCYFEKPDARMPRNHICRLTKFGLMGDGGLQAPLYAADKMWNDAHVDLSEVTIIHVEEGLEIYSGSEIDPWNSACDQENWHRVPAKQASRDCALIILGLASEIRSAGHLRAVWHRVRIPSGTKPHIRWSVVGFGNAGTTDTLSSGDASGRRSNYPSVRRDLLPVVGNERYMKLIGSG